MMPVYPGAPWLPTFKGTEGETKYREWRVQIRGLLSTQDVTEVKKVAILLQTLTDEARRQVNVLDDGDRDTVEKLFAYLDSVYKETVPVSKVRSQFYSCTQRSGESVNAFILRLRELFCGLRRYDAATAPSEAVLRDQFLQGLAEGPLGQALRIYARRHPDEDFAALRQEALTLDVEHGGTPATEIVCHAINPVTVPVPSQTSAWREELKREIMEDVKTQMKGFTKELMNEMRPLMQAAAPAVRPAPPPPQPAYVPPPRRYAPPQRNEWDREGRPICRQCNQPGHIARWCANGQPPLN